MNEVRQLKYSKWCIARCHNNVYATIRSVVIEVRLYFQRFSKKATSFDLSIFHWYKSCLDCKVKQNMGRILSTKTTIKVESLNGKTFKIVRHPNGGKPCSSLTLEFGRRLLRFSNNQFPCWKRVTLWLSSQKGGQWRQKMSHSKSITSPLPCLAWTGTHFSNT